MAIKFGQIRGAQIKNESIKTEHIQGTINRSKLDLGHLTAEDSRLQGEIDNLKSAVEGKGTANKVFETMEEFQTFAAEPGETLVVGTLAYVVDVKKSYIYKGEPGPMNLVEMYGKAAPPENWVVFDEISSELDLTEYAKTAEITETITSGDDAVRGELTAYKEQLKGTGGAAQVGANVPGISDNNVQAVLVAIDNKAKAAQQKANTNEQAITKLNADHNTDGSVDNKIKKAKQEITTAQQSKDQAQDREIEAIKASIGEGSVTEKIEQITQKNEEQDAAIEQVKGATHKHKKFVKTITGPDDKDKVATPEEFTIPTNMEGLYENSVHVYVNGILQVEGINFSFINHEQAPVEDGKGKGVSFGAGALVDGDTVVIEWIAAGVTE